MIEDWASSGSDGRLGLEYIIRSVFRMVVPVSRSVVMFLSKLPTKMAKSLQIFLFGNDFVI